MDDHYCKICKAHMNSGDMWESHISGKRHLKNLKKELEAPHPPSQENSIEDLCDKRSYSSVSEATSTHRKLRLRHHSRSPYSERPKRYRSPDSSYSSHRKKASNSPVDGKWRHDKFFLHEQSPLPPPRRHSSPHSNDGGLQLLAEELTPSAKVDLMKKLSRSIIVVSENEAKRLKSVVTLLFHEYLLARVKELPHSARKRLRDLIEEIKEQEFEEVPLLNSKSRDAM